MTLQERISLLVQLGKYLTSGDEFLRAVMHRTHYNNGWLTIENCEKAARAIAQNYLQKDQLINWVNNYKVEANSVIKKVGIVMAGNIPLVGFHDLLCVFLSGNKAMIKLSDKDKFLIPHLTKKMTEWQEASNPYFDIRDKLTQFDAVLATGSNKVAR